MKIALALLSAILTLLTPLRVSALKPKLFAVGSFPPNVTARDTSGKAVEMRSLRGRKRVVLLSTQNEAYQDDVRRHRAQFAERDIVVLTTSWPSFQFYLWAKMDLSRWLNTLHLRTRSSSLSLMPCPCAALKCGGTGEP